MPLHLGALLSFSLLFADPFSFEYPGTTEASGSTSLTILANEDTPAFELVIAGDDQTIKKSVPALEAGKKFKVTWKQRGAQAKYQLNIDGGEVQADFGFERIKPKAMGKVG